MSFAFAAIRWPLSSQSVKASPVRNTFPFSSTISSRKGIANCWNVSDFLDLSLRTNREEEHNADRETHAHEFGFADHQSLRLRQVDSGTQLIGRVRGVPKACCKNFA
jgi:hypothetical protein